MKQFITLVSLTFFLGACSKKETEKKETNKELLMKHEWRIGQTTLNGTIMNIKDCEADDHWQFKDNGIGYFQFGVKCDSADASFYSFNWSLNETQSTLYVTNLREPDNNFIFEIKSIDNSSFVYTRTAGGNFSEFRAIAK